MITAVPRSRSAMIRLWMNSIEPDVDAAGRLGGDQHLQRPGELPRDDDLLLVAAGQRRHRRLGGLGADVELLDPVVGVRRDRVELEREPAGELVVAVEVEDEVLADAERADEAVVGAVLGDVADAVVEALARAVLGDVLAVEHGSRRRRA